MKILLFIPVIFLCACTGIAPVIETQTEKTVAYRVTAPEIVTEAGTLPAVDYTVPVSPSEIGEPLPPESLPAGAVATPVKILVRESVVNPAWVNALEIASGVNSVANPTPTAPLVGIGIAGIGYILGGIAAFRNRQTARAVDQFKGALVTVVRGVEAFQSPDLKELISKKAQVEGTSQILHKTVKENT